MKPTKFILLLTLALLSCWHANAQNGPSMNQRSDITGGRPPAVPTATYEDLVAMSALQQQQSELAAQKAAEKAAEQAEMRRQQEAETESKFNALKADAADKALAVTNADRQIEILRKSFLDAKLKIPIDPWRVIHSEQIYAMSPDSDLLKFSGQILEVDQNGILVMGGYGNKYNVEFFVINFPYNSRGGG